MPVGENYKNWVVANIEHIYSQIEKSPRRKKNNLEIAAELRANQAKRIEKKQKIRIKKDVTKERRFNEQTPRSNNPFVGSNDFLQSYEWRKIRMEVLLAQGRRCQCCGATPATGAIMNVDHIKPRRLFPELALDISNLQVLCHECNHGKGNWDQTDFR